MTSPKPSLSDLKIHRAPQSQKSIRIWPIVLVIAVLAAGSAAGWLLTRPKPLEVQTAVARETGGGNTAGTERTVLDASGYVTSRREATVSSKITGKVVEVLVEEGMRIKEGQILARLDDTNVTASLQLAIAQLEATKASLAETRVRVQEAEREYQRQKSLTTKQVVSQSETDRTQATLLASQARLRQQEAEIAVAERTVDSWRQQWDDTIIRAPFSGIVTSKNAQPGEMISPMSSGGFTRTGICTIVDMESLEIEIDVNESYINRVEAGQGVIATLDAYQDWKIPCKVIAIIPTADRQKSTVKVRVGFVKLDPRILPEMSVKVSFRETAHAGAASAATTGTRAVTVPKAAVFQENGRDMIFVIRDGKAELRAVSVMSSGADEAIIGSGVSGGERVAIVKPNGLADGVPVRDANK